MKVSPARLAAYDVLFRMETERAFSSVLLPSYEADLSEKDRALCHELTLGVLRRQLYLDRVIDVVARSKKLDTEVRIALRLGAYQLISLDRVPVYSAISESVNLVQRAKKTSAKGLVNAVLRRISENIPEITFADDLDRLSITTSHPRWLVERWSGQFGEQTAEQIAATNNCVPRVAFRLTEKGKAAVGDLSAFQRSELVDDAWFAASLSKELRDLSDQGEIYFQDEASQLVARVAASNAGTRFLDVCAAPGGKTTLVAAYAPATAIVAGDLHSQRVELLRATCERQAPGRVGVIRYDAEAELPFAEGAFETVLVDAPCSGTGTIRHNPEIRYFLDPGDSDELSKKQRRILAGASKLVSPGGRLIYSTCSLEREENEATAGVFLKEAAGFRRVSPQVRAGLLTDEGYARTFPHRDGTDGFFIAEFVRG